MVVFVCLFVFIPIFFFFRCFKVYIDSEFWYAHSVEELVIWTVEREHGTCVCVVWHRDACYPKLETNPKI